MSRALVLIVAFGVLNAPPAFAHDDELDGGLLDAGVSLEHDGDGDADHQHLDGGPHQEAPVAVTTVRGQRLSRSASEVTVSQDIVQAAPRTGAVDLLRLVPGLVASQHSGEGRRINSSSVASTRSTDRTSSSTSPASR